MTSSFPWGGPELSSILKGSSPLAYFHKENFLKEAQKEHFGPTSTDDYSFQILFLLQILLSRVKQESTVECSFGSDPDPPHRFTKPFQFRRVLMEPG